MAQQLIYKNVESNLCPQLISVITMALFYVAISCFATFFLGFLSIASAKCYYPNGTAVIGLDFQPCVSTLGAVSMCCATNRTIQDSCLPNGLCFNPCTSNGDCGDGSGGKYWRESCTDQSWKSPFCLQGACDDNAVGLKFNLSCRGGGD